MLLLDRSGSQVAALHDAWPCLAFKIIGDPCVCHGRLQSESSIALQQRSPRTAYVHAEGEHAAARINELGVAPCYTSLQKFERYNNPACNCLGSTSLHVRSREHARQFKLSRYSCSLRFKLLETRALSWGAEARPEDTIVTEVAFSKCSNEKTQSRIVLRGKAHRQRPQQLFFGCNAAALQLAVIHHLQPSADCIFTNG